jgi:hypothetical protein
MKLPEIRRINAGRSRDVDRRTEVVDNESRHCRSYERAFFDFDDRSDDDSGDGPPSVLSARFSRTKSMVIDPKMSRRRWMRSVGGLVGLGGAVAVIDAVAWAPHRLEIVRRDVPIADLPNR